jgi:DNA-binding MarR family transcriptional regulator
VRFGAFCDAVQSIAEQEGYAVRRRLERDTDAERVTIFAKGKEAVARATRHEIVRADSIEGLAQRKYTQAIAAIQ